MRRVALLLVAAINTVSGSSAHATIVISSDSGGLVSDYAARFLSARDSGEQVVIDGACLSACTLVVGLVKRDKVCATPNAALGFHSAWRRMGRGKRVNSPVASEAMLNVYPAELRKWIVHRGGLGSKMIFLHGHELAEIVPSCGSSMLAANDPPHQLSTVPQSKDDLLDRRAVLGQGENCCIDLLPPQIAFVLQAFRGGEQIGIDRCRANRRADLAHRLADRVEECPACVLHQVPAIGDLGGVGERLRGSFTVSAAAVPSDDGNLLMLFKPSRGGRRFAVGEQRHRPTPFEIADNRSVAVIAAPRPIINADDVEPVAGHPGPSAHHAKERVLAHGQHQPLGKAGGRPSAECQTEMMDDMIEPCSSPRPRG
jgi:hypothetical protein